MLEYIKYLLFCYGLTAIFMYGDIASPIRNLITWEPLKKMTNCAMCLGFWVGFFVSCIWHTDITIGWVEGLIPVPVSTSGLFPSLKSAWINGIASSGVTWLLCAHTLNALWGKVVMEEDYFDGKKEPTEERKIDGFRSHEHKEETPNG